MLHSLKIGRREPSTFHLFFDDNSFLFVHAAQNEAPEGLYILNNINFLLGNCLKLDKTEGFFAQHVCDMLVGALGFKAVEMQQ